MHPRNGTTRQRNEMTRPNEAVMHPGKPLHHKNKESIVKNSRCFYLSIINKTLYIYGNKAEQQAEPKGTGQRH